MKNDHLANKKGRERGSSLLLVIWATMMMSLAVIGLINYLTAGVDDGIREAKLFRARLLTESALVLARHPKLSATDPLLAQPVTSASRYAVLRTTEGGRIAVNQFAANAVVRGIAQRLFEDWGFDAQEALALVEAMADWTDSDDDPRTYGAERDVYIQRGMVGYPLNRAFRTLDEMLNVPGMEEVERVVPDWRGRFTVYGDGTVDLNEASPEIVKAVFDVAPDVARRFVEERSGPDGVFWTEDDIRFGDMARVRTLLDVGESEFGEVSAALVFDHPIKRFEALVQVGDLVLTTVSLRGGGVDRTDESWEVLAPGGVRVQQ